MPADPPDLSAAGETLALMPRRLLLLLAALTVLALTSLAGIASAASTGVSAQTRVGALQTSKASFIGLQPAGSSCTRPGSAADSARIAVGFCVATEDGENPVERIYEANPKHGAEPYTDSQGRVVSPAPTNGQGALDNSSQIKPTSPTRQGIDPDTGETVILPRHLVQNFPDRTVEYYHGYVP